jgi:uncharacterized membrane protein YgcG
MTRPPFDRPRDSRDLPESADPVIRELEAYTSLTAGEHPHGLTDRVMAAVADEPMPRRGFLAGLLASLDGGRGAGMTRMVMVAGTMALAVLAVVLAGQLANLFGDQQIGPSPVPSVLESAPPLTTEPPSPSPTESPSARPSRTPRPSPSDAEAPEPSESPDDDDERETPEPSGSDNSGPGGGDGGNSGPGGGDSSGSGSGSDDSSGPGSGDGSG